MGSRRAALAARRAVVGYSQEALAERLGVERSTVARWESGSSTPQPWSRPRLASVLGISIEALAALLTDHGEQVRTGPVVDRGAVPEEAERSDVSPIADLVHIQLPKLRRVLDAHDLPEDGPVRPLGELRQLVAAVVSKRLQSNYGLLAVELPILLTELMRAFLSRAGAERGQVASLLAQAYRAADAIADKLGYYDLSAHIIGLLRWAAHEAADDLLMATASYVRTETFFTNGDLETGRKLLERAADRVQVGSSRTAAATYGALHMRAAVTAARSGKATCAFDHLAEADRIAERVPEGTYMGTAFGPESVRIHRVTLAVDLGNSGAALQTAEGWKPPASMPAERRSHFYVDLARAHLQAGQPDQILDSLMTARVIAPEHIQVHPEVRAVLRQLIQSSATPADGLIEFNRWIRQPEIVR